ncbi:NAD(P)/FAD-dependent oxidoreductase [Hydrogenophaga aquatica]
MDAVDCVVVGAGVVGLAVARSLAATGREVVVLERENAIGTGVSSRNSEVIHAGLYYTPGSAKARLCVLGKELLYRFCESHGVQHRRCGKLVVATEDAQLPALRQLAERAEANGVPVRMLGAEEARALEPALRCKAALFSPSTGIVDSHGLMLALQGDLEAAGGAVALGSRLVSARQQPGGWHLSVQMDDGGEMELLARAWVNAAGLHACSVAQATEGLAPSFQPVPHYAKGSYYALSGRAPFSHLIYPAPQDAWLGVHLTLDLGGQARFGPDHEWLDVGDPAAIDYRVDPRRADGFYAEVRRYWPDLPDGALQPAYSGVRPKIHGPGEPAPDFRIDGPAQHGLPGLVNLLGIESPGLTSALAIGEHVASLLGSAA